MIACDNVDLVLTSVWGIPADQARPSSSRLRQQFHREGFKRRGTIMAHGLHVAICSVDWHVIRWILTLFQCQDCVPNSLF